MYLYIVYHLSVLELELRHDQLRNFGAMWDIMVFQLRANEKKQVTEFHAVDNTDRLER